MVEYIDIIKRLVQYRRNNHLTQMQLAEIFSITQCQVSKLEANEYRISYYDLLQLHTKTNLDIDFLITGKQFENTIFHTLEKDLFPIPSIKYRYIDLILFSLNNFYGQISISEKEQEHLKRLQRLLRYSLLSGSKHQSNCWVNIRNAFDLTQIQMAKIVDVDIKRYRNIEKGERTANAELLMNVYNALEICPSYFICGKLENYKCLENIFQSLSEQNQQAIIQFLKEGIKFINQTIENTF